MEQLFANFYALSYNYQDHDLGVLADFETTHDFYQRLQQMPVKAEIQSALYFSTCNRVEIYFELATGGLNQQQATAALVEAGILPGLKTGLTPTFRRATAAIAEFFKVTAGLKSMAIGETQITGQIKKAYQGATEVGLVSNQMRSIVEKSLETQKAIRHETAIGKDPVSLLTLLENELRSRQYASVKHVALGGTGDMSEKVLRHYLNKKCNQFTIIRHDTNARLPADFEKTIKKAAGAEIRFINWSELSQHSDLECDLLVTSTYSNQPLLNFITIADLRKKKFLKAAAPVVDLGVPANVSLPEDSPEAALLINLSVLLAQSEKNLQQRRERLKESLPLIARALREFWADAIYRQNARQVNSVLEEIESQREQEWQELVEGPLSNMNAKQKRILHDFFRKRERTSMRRQRELLFDIFSSQRLEEVALSKK